MLQERDVECIRGNHDAAAVGLMRPRRFSPPARKAIRWTARVLTAASRRFLAALPMVRLLDGRYVIVHGALHPQPNDEVRIRQLEDARSSLEVLERDYSVARVCFFGHTHRAGAFRIRRGAVSEIMDAQLHLDAGERWLVNPGSVGQSRDRDSRAAFIVYDETSRTVRFHRVAYDRAAAQAKRERFGLVYRPHLARRAAWRIGHMVASAGSAIRGGAK